MAPSKLPPTPSKAEVGSEFDLAFYRGYLASNEWRELANDIRAAQRGICGACREMRQLDVHHHTYERLGMEAPGDLVALCRGCHTEVHELAKTHRRTSATYSESLALGWLELKERRRLMRIIARDRRKQ